MTDKRVLPNGAYTTDYQGTRQRISSSYMGAFTSVIPSGASVVDIGAGIGIHVDALRRAGYVAHGLDGTPNVYKKSNGLVYEFDLSSYIKDRAAPFSAEWGVCFEVGEHIPAKYESNVFQNITELSRKNLMITWAVPEDVGIEHVNCHHPVYVAQAFAFRGWVFDEYSTNKATHLMRAKYKNKLMVFRR